MNNSKQDPEDPYRPQYHSLLHRGVRSLHLAEPAPDRSSLTGLKTWELRADNLMLPEDDHTHYWCR